ncbi:MAG TPA: type 1 glutamine amidotransferase domain-containing protein, partial [Cellvibrionaceae bacterium]
GEPPAVIDGDDMGLYDYAFLNDKLAQQKVINSLAIETINPDDYRAVYFVGGKGAMFDFPDNKTIQSLVRDYYEQGKVIGAVCHGPAALVNVTLSNGKPLLEGKSVTGFTNREELLLISNAREIFPFLLEDKLTHRGGVFNEGDLYLNNISQDHHLLTGQNPWSVWTLAEEMVSQLGYKPVPREVTAEENTVSVLQVYESQGYSAAKSAAREHLSETKTALTRNLIVMHSLVAVMQGRIGKAIDMISLARLVKSLQ